MKLTLLFAAIVVVLLPFAILASNIAFAPTSWNQVHVGDSSDDVKKAFPAVDDSLHAAKGFDFLIERRLTGKWITFYFYGPDNRIRFKLLQYRIGTSRHFIVGSVTREPASLN